MRMSRGGNVVASILAASLMLLAATGCAATSSTASRRGGPTHRVVRVIHPALAVPVLDTAHHVVYGVTLHRVVAFNERTNSGAVIMRFGRRRQVESIGVDSSANRLVVGVLVIPPSDRARELAQLVDPATGHIIRSAPIGHFRDTAFIPFQGATAVDSSLHHAIVVDVFGHGAMVDTITGAVLARFVIGAPGNTGGQNDDAKVDERMHRAFIGLMGGPQLAAINTSNGRVIRNGGRGAPVDGLALSQRTGHVFTIASSFVTMSDARSGLPIRQVFVGFLGSAIAVDDSTGRVFALALASEPGSRHGALQLLSTRTGQVVRKIRSAGTKAGLPAMAVDPLQGRVFIGYGQSDKIDVFDARSGFHLYDLHLREPVAYGMAVDTRSSSLCGRSLRALRGRHPHITMTSLACLPLRNQAG